MNLWIIVLVIVVFFLTGSKTLFFVLTLIPIRIIKRHAVKIVPNRSPLSETFVTPKVTLKSFVFSYIDSYIHYSIILTGKIPSHTIRNFLYKHIYLIRMSSKVVLYHGAEIRESQRLSIGEGTIIGDRAILDARNGICIGKSVNASSDVSIWTEQHDHRDPWFRCNPEKLGPVIIGDRVWIGPRVIILPNVIIGEGAVIAAGAVVSTNVEPFTVVGGIPARKIGDRNRDLRYEFNGSRRHFL